MRPDGDAAPVVSRRLWQLASAVLLVTLATRAIRLGSPGVLVFDEAYYALNAWDIAEHGVEQANAVHPPLAKWLIAGGIRTIGFTPWGWRISALLAGAMAAGMVTIAAGIISRSNRLAALAGLVVLTDGVAFVTGRLALLDGFVAMFTTLTVTAACAAVTHHDRPRLVRRCGLVVGVASGAALACKWSAAPAWIVAAAAIGWAAAQHSERVGRVMATVLLVPIAVYAISYLPTLLRYDGSAVQRLACAAEANCDTDLGGRVRAIGDYHVRVLRYHRSLEPTNRYAVSSVNWIVQSSPTVLFDDDGRRVVMRGNPVVWAGCCAAVLAAGWLGVRRRQAPLVMLATTAMAWWLPWAVGGRPGYSFYAAPLIPVLAVVLVSVIPRQRWLTWLVASTCIGGAMVLWPDWVAL